MVNLHKKWFVLFAAIVVIVLLFVSQTKGQQGTGVAELEAYDSEKLQEETVKEADLKEQPSMIIVDIKGAVVHEGVYELKGGSRVKDGIEKAGGFLAEADRTKVNLAQIVQDEMMIYVPKIGEQVQGVHTPGMQEEQKIYVNVATKEELEKIPGVGPKKAENIMNYREENGPFQKVEDLLEVDGIGEKSLEKIKDYIIVP